MPYRDSKTGRPKYAKPGEQRVTRPAAVYMRIAAPSISLIIDPF
jgi:hypothetical protein